MTDDPAVQFDAGVGFRNFNLGLDVNLSAGSGPFGQPAGGQSFDKNWTDPLIAARVMVPLNEKWFLSGLADFGEAMRTTLEVVTTDKQKLDIASSGSIAVARPDKFQAMRHGGFASVDPVYDGRTLSVMNMDSKVYGQTDVTGSIDDVITLLRNKLHRPLPAADLLSSDAGASLMANVTDAKDLGSGVIRGEECDHLAFRTKEVDWQIWVAQGKVPHPCRFTVTSKEVPGSPSYTIEFSAWETGAAKADFVFAAPDGATKADVKNIPNLDDLAGIYLTNGAN